MNMILLIILFLVAFALQYLLTFIQMRSFNEHYRNLRKQGRVAIGKSKGAIRAGAIAMFAINSEGIILEGSYLQGVTVFARFHTLKGFEGMDVGKLTAEDCKQLHLAKPLSKAVIEASSNYNILMSGKEIPEEPAPLTKVANLFRRRSAHTLKGGKQ
ncbi:MAG: transcriptional regulator GutM [Lachnospiraceae bacterium]|nr:transcriptional regulator GutM [Lachnospiraceae bacterium]